MRLKPFFTYYGGKHRIAMKYPPPNHSTIIEPFCGSAGYSLAHNKKTVKLFDLNERIVGIWNYLIKVKESEILNLPIKVSDTRELRNIPQEAKWLIGFWCNKGTCEPANKPTTWMLNGTSPNSFWGEAIRNRVCMQLKDIRHWSCEQKDYQNISDNSQATWFIDPPYSAKPGRLYKHNKIDYSMLSLFCKERRGQVIVCEMQGASWLPFETFCTAKAKAKNE
jgi:site-specific DNA-adenine methylase